MAKVLEPKVIMLAQTDIDAMAVEAMLKEVGVEHPPIYVTDNYDMAGIQPGEWLIELAGRLCYKSFEVGLNKNVTRVREGNDKYIGNILASKHGSVLEHATVTFAFLNVTRVFTHEAVRNRAGNAFSQESLRYVRLDNIGYRFPSIFKEDSPFLQQLHDALPNDDGMSHERIPTWRRDLECEFEDAFKEAEQRIARITDRLGLDTLGLNFEIKKKVTSALRRLVPDGICTNLIMTGNHRAWRYFLEQRTSVHAEEEIREVVKIAGQQLKDSFPNIYQDMTLDATDQWVFANSKI